jgi:hypothetical protein
LFSNGWPSLRRKTLWARDKLTPRAILTPPAPVVFAES